MLSFSKRRKTVEMGEEKHYAVRIVVYEHNGFVSCVDETLNIAADSEEQAIRMAGMRLVHKLSNKHKGKDQ